MRDLVLGWWLTFAQAGLTPARIDKLAWRTTIFITISLVEDTGLSIIKKVIEDHGGFIHGNNQIGLGTTSIVYFSHAQNR